MATGDQGSASVVSQAPQAVRQAVQSGIVRVRRNVEQADIAALTDAYTTLQGRSETDNRSWVALAEIHGFDRFLCWHHAGVGSQRFPYDLFLPWHRAYLLLWEQTALAVNPGASLPWWQWTSQLSHQIGLPKVFTTEDSLISGPVPSGLRTDPPRTTRDPDSPDNLPTPAQLESVLEITDFARFSDQLQGLHDSIHVWVGGDMGVVPASAFDPIFWSHHCMIDRAWYLWQLRHGVNNIPPNYLDMVLAPWNLKVRDVLDTSALGYTYGATRIKMGAGAFSAVRLPATK